jgi:hypothetical protein
MLLSEADAGPAARLAPVSTPCSSRFEMADTVDQHVAAAAGEAPLTGQDTRRSGQSAAGRQGHAENLPADTCAGNGVEFGIGQGNGGLASGVEGFGVCHRPIPLAAGQWLVRPA